MATALERRAYARYMKTNRWQELRDAVLERDGHECRRCGARHHLQVHHLTYARVYSERLEDLITWCKHCHIGHHERQIRRHGRRASAGAGICRGCGEEMIPPYWGPGGGYYCGFTCKHAVKSAA